LIGSYRKAGVEYDLIKYYCSTQRPQQAKCKQSTTSLGRRCWEEMATLL